MAFNEMLKLRKHLNMSQADMAMYFGVKRILNSNAIAKYKVSHSDQIGVPLTDWLREVWELAG
jgi:hypothetical protein